MFHCLNYHSKSIPLSKTVNAVVGITVLYIHCLHYVYPVPRRIHPIRRQGSHVTAGVQKRVYCEQNISRLLVLVFPVSYRLHRLSNCARLVEHELRSERGGGEANSPHSCATYAALMVLW